MKAFQRKEQLRPVGLPLGRPPRRDEVWLIDLPFDRTAVGRVLQCLKIGYADIRQVTRIAVEIKIGGGRPTSTHDEPCAPLRRH